MHSQRSDRTVRYLCSPSPPPRVRYQLTSYGNQLTPYLDYHRVMARPLAKKVPPQTHANSQSPLSFPPIVYPRSESWEFPAPSRSSPVLSQNQVLENHSLHAAADTDLITPVSKAKTKLRSSHVRLQENRKEVLVTGFLRWRRQRCNWLPPAVTACRR